MKQTGTSPPILLLRVHFWSDVDRVTSNETGDAATSYGTVNNDNRRNR